MNSRNIAIRNELTEHMIEAVPARIASAKGLQRVSTSQSSLPLSGSPQIQFMKCDIINVRTVWLADVEIALCTLTEEFLFVTNQVFGASDDSA